MPAPPCRKQRFQITCFCLALVNILFIFGQVSPKHLHPHQRVTLIKRGLSDSSDVVVDACRFMLCAHWFRDVEYDPVELLKRLEVLHFEVRRMLWTLHDRTCLYVASGVWYRVHVRILLCEGCGISRESLWRSRLMGATYELALRVRIGKRD